MLRRLIQNTAISAVAYVLAGVLGLVVVGLIARSYGLAVLGLIVLVRSFLPTGFLALFDLGVSETTTQVVARGRVGDWKVASEKLSLLVVIAGVMGVVSGVALWMGAGALANVFKVAPDQVAPFIAILHATALVLPIAFLGLVAEGALKGFEQYGWLRLTEVGGNVLYVVTVYVMVWHGAPFEWIAYSYLAITVAKYFVLMGVVSIAALESSLRLHSWTTPSRKDVLHRCWLMFNNRVMGTFQQPLVPLVIGILFTPVEVGAYDLITRLPRFLKATMAPLYSAILPISTRIDEATDTRRLQVLGRNGFVLPGAIVIPILVVGALFSQEILKVWLGQQYADQWPWLALSMLVPAVTVMLGAAQMALIAQSDFLRFITRVMYLQVFVQYLVAVLTLVWFRERAFILGWVFSYVAFAPVLASHMLSQMQVPRSLFWEQIGRQLIVAAIIAGLFGVGKMFFDPGSLISLAIVGGFSCLVAWGLSAAIILSKADLVMFGKFARAIMPRS